MLKDLITTITLLFLIVPIQIVSQEPNPPSCSSWKWNLMGTGLLGLSILKGIETAVSSLYSTAVYDSLAKTRPDRYPYTLADFQKKGYRFPSFSYMFRAWRGLTGCFLKRKALGALSLGLGSLGCFYGVHTCASAKKTNSNSL